MAFVGSSAPQSAIGTNWAVVNKFFNVDIYIREKYGGREIRVPWLPEKIKYDSGGITAATYDIMNRGEVSIPTGTGLATVTWESEFPGEKRTDDSMMRGSWKSPSVYHEILEDWRKKGTVLNLLVTGYPINFDVILEDYNAEPTGGFGDLAYEVRFLEYRDITVTVSKSTNNGGTQRPTTQTTSYTIKSGDTLWAISQKYLGSGAKWETIYLANKEIIEATAKKHGRSSSSWGHMIYPGCKITIPG